MFKVYHWLHTNPQVYHFFPVLLAGITEQVGVEFSFGGPDLILITLLATSGCVQLFKETVRLFTEQTQVPPGSAVLAAACKATQISNKGLIYPGKATQNFQQGFNLPR